MQQQCSQIHKLDFENKNSCLGEQHKRMCESAVTSSGTVPPRGVRDHQTIKQGGPSHQSSFVWFGNTVDNNNNNNTSLFSNCLQFSLSDLKK